MMEKMIFSGFGIDIIERDEGLFVRYDSGTIVSQLRELPISKGEAAKAQISEKDAYDVILACQLREANSG